MPKKSNMRTNRISLLRLPELSAFSICLQGNPIIINSQSQASAPCAKVNSARGIDLHWPTNRSKRVSDHFRVANNPPTSSLPLTIPLIDSEHVEVSAK